MAESCLPTGRGLRRSIFYVYVLYSKKDKGIYVGKTNDVDRRLSEHNAGRVSSTKSRRPLSLIKKFSYRTESEALVAEKELKKGYRREQLKRELGL